MEYAFWSAQSVIAQQQALRSEAAALGLGLDAPTLRKLMHEQHQQQQKDKEKQQQQQQQGGTGGSGGSRGGEEDGEEGESGGAAAAGSSSGRGTAGAAGTASTAEDPRIRILDVDDLLELFERKCAEAQAAAAADGVGGGGEGPGGERRHMVGLVGYPNVGKSSTINALFGAKKTAVAPTPGKTKHFQTLHVSPEVGVSPVARKQAAGVRARLHGSGKQDSGGRGLTLSAAHCALRLPLVCSRYAVSAPATGPASAIPLL